MKTQIHDPDAAFTTTGDGLRGVPVMLMDRDNGSILHSRVYSNTATILTLDTPLSRDPDRYDAYILGSVPICIESGDLSFGRQDTVKTLRYFQCQFERGSTGHLDFYVASNQQSQTDTAWQYAGTIALKGRTQARLPVNVPGGTGRIIRYLIVGMEPGQTACLTSLVLKIDHEQPV